MIKIDFNKFIHKIILRIFINFHETNSPAENFSFHVYGEVNLRLGKICTIWVNLKLFNRKPEQ